MGRCLLQVGKECGFVGELSSELVRRGFQATAECSLEALISSLFARHTMQSVANMCPLHRHVEIVQKGYHSQSNYNCNLSVLLTNYINIISYSRIQDLTLRQLCYLIEYFFEMVLIFITHQLSLHRTFLT